MASFFSNNLSNDRGSRYDRKKVAVPHEVQDKFFKSSRQELMKSTETSGYQLPKKQSATIDFMTTQPSRNMSPENQMKQ